MGLYQTTTCAQPGAKPCASFHHFPVKALLVLFPRVTCLVVTKAVTYDLGHILTGPSPAKADLAWSSLAFLLRQEVCRHCRRCVPLLRSATLRVLYLHETSVLGADLSAFIFCSVAENISKFWDICGYLITTSDFPRFIDAATTLPWPWLAWHGAGTSYLVEAWVCWGLRSILQNSMNEPSRVLPTGPTTIICDIPHCEEFRIKYSLWLYWFLPFRNLTEKLGAFLVLVIPKKCNHLGKRAD